MADGRTSEVGHSISALECPRKKGLTGVSFLFCY